MPVLTVVNAGGSTLKGSLADEIVREGARRLPAAALEAEVGSCIAELAGERDGDGRRLVVRNGYHQPWKGTTAAGTVEVRAPWVNDERVDDTTRERERFSSAILPPWCRKSPKISEVLPLLCPHGLSCGDYVPALEQFLGSSDGLPPATVTRLTARWRAGRTAFMDRELSATDYVYVRADGVRLRIRRVGAKAAVLVLRGVRAHGTKDLTATTDGHREPSEARAGLLRDCARRGMRAPVLAVGDGAPGLWNAPSEVFPDTRRQRCRVHKTADVSDALPKSARPAAKRAIQEICNAEDKEHAARAVRDFERAHAAKCPKAAKRITDDEDELPAFFGSPAEHRTHLRTADPIEPAFATARLRTKVTKITKVTGGAGPRAAGPAMVFKLIQSAQARRRAVNAPHLVTLVRAGTRCKGGQLVEREERAA